MAPRHGRAELTRWASQRQTNRRGETPSHAAPYLNRVPFPPTATCARESTEWSSAPIAVATALEIIWQPRARMTYPEASGNGNYKVGGPCSRAAQDISIRATSFGAGPPYSWRLGET